MLWAGNPHQRPPARCSAGWLPAGCSQPRLHGSINQQQTQAVGASEVVKGQERAAGEVRAGWKCRAGLPRTGPDGINARAASKQQRAAGWVTPVLPTSQTKLACRAAQQAAEQLLSLRVIGVVQVGGILRPTGR